MKNLYQFLFGFVLMITFCLLSSCVVTSVLSASNKYEKVYKNGEDDISDYADYIIEDYMFPDGKKATVYVFDNVGEGIVWQNLQTRKYYTEWQQEANQKYEKERKKGYDYSYFYKWYPTGPLSPFFKAVGTLADEIGMESVREAYVNNHPPVSYYNNEDLGSISEIMGANSTAYACYEDSDGVYFLVISKPKYLSEKIVSSEMKKLHKNEFAYEVSFVPKELYDVPPVKIEPAKTEPFDPNSVPDSNRNLFPDNYKGDSVYYYDAQLAYQLQWLAVEIACKGKYDMAYTGEFYTSNPHDYYDTKLIKKYLVEKAGGRTRTDLFEGICFDYADYAYQEIKNNKSEFLNIIDFYIVGTYDSFNINTYRFAEKGEDSSDIINGTPVVNVGQYHIVAHDNAKKHAWLWVRGTDGVIYWIDPTWTDNTGRPVYGVVRGGKEIQLAPSYELCVN